MSNMSYGRFENTLADLEDCEEALAELGGFDEIDSGSERRCAIKLVRLCSNIAHDFDYWLDEESK